MPLHPPKQSGSIVRFRTAQDKRWPFISREIATGRKKTHWMWFVFPQLRDFAKSETAHYFGIADRTEALAYLDDDVLRIRLATATVGVLKQDRLMFSDVDYRKLHRCMTLFREVVKDPTIPDQVIGKHFGGELHAHTLDVLAGRPIPQQPWTPTAMGRVEIKGKARDVMGKHWEKQVAQARAAVAAVGQRPPRESNDPMDSTEIASFIRGFGLSEHATQRIVREWIADQTRAHTQGWEEADNAAYYG